jgi:hypothetical protein
MAKERRESQERHRFQHPNPPAKATEKEPRGCAKYGCGRPEAHDLHRMPERWYRLTTPTGPAAIETCEVVDGKVVSRKVVEEKNVRAVVLARLGDILDGVEES